MCLSGLKPPSWKMFFLITEGKNYFQSYNLEDSTFNQVTEVIIYNKMCGHNVFRVHISIKG